MTEERKKEIREAALQLKGGLAGVERIAEIPAWNNIIDALKGCTEMILELTSEPNRAPLGEETRESQEEMLKEIMTELNGGRPWLAMEEHFQRALSMFTISRRSPDKSVGKNERKTVN